MKRLGLVITFVVAGASGCGGEGFESFACPEIELNPAPFDPQQAWFADDPIWEVGQRVPGFGGLYVYQPPAGRAGPTTQFVYLVEPTEEVGQQALSVIEEVYGRREGPVVFLRAAYDIQALVEWIHLIEPGVSALGGSFDIDEGENRIGIGVRTSLAAACISENLWRLGVPRNVVGVSVVEPVTPD